MGRVMGHSGYRENLADDMGRLRRLLERSLPAARAAVEGEVRILDLACGACDEAATLSEFFGRVRGEGARPPVTTRLIGADIRDRELDHARERFRSGKGSQFEFLRADASALDAHRELPADFDYVFIRHQNLYHGRTLWRRIFEQGLARLKADGSVVMTSYFDREHELAIEAFHELGAELVTSIRNPSSRALPTAGKSVDRHLAVLRKARS